jgi:ATP-binding cassette subfamily B protein
VDNATERLIQEALDRLLQKRTSFVIAHRLSTIGYADRIVVMKKGTIIEEGSHNGLLEQNGHYAELYNTYFRHQSLAYVEQMKEMVGK